MPIQLVSSFVCLLALLNLAYAAPFRLGCNLQLNSTGTFPDDTTIQWELLPAHDTNWVYVLETILTYHHPVKGSNTVFYAHLHRCSVNPPFYCDPSFLELNPTYSLTPYFYTYVEKQQSVVFLYGQAGEQNFREERLFSVSLNSWKIGLVGSVLPWSVKDEWLPLPCSHSGCPGIISSGDYVYLLRVTDFQNGKEEYVRFSAETLTIEDDKIPRKIDDVRAVSNTVYLSGKVHYAAVGSTGSSVIVRDIASWNVVSNITFPPAWRNPDASSVISVGYNGAHVLWAGVNGNMGPNAIGFAEIQLTGTTGWESVNIPFQLWKPAAIIQNSVTEYLLTNGDSLNSRPGNLIRIGDGEKLMLDTIGFFYSAHKAGDEIFVTYGQYQRNFHLLSFS